MSSLNISCQIEFQLGIWSPKIRQCPPLLFDQAVKYNVFSKKKQHQISLTPLPPFEQCPKLSRFFTSRSSLRVIIYDLHRDSVSRQCSVTIWYFWLLERNNSTFVVLRLISLLCWKWDLVQLTNLPVSFQILPGEELFVTLNTHKFLVQCALHGPGPGMNL